MKQQVEEEQHRLRQNHDFSHGQHGVGRDRHRNCQQREIDERRNCQEQPRRTGPLDSGCDLAGPKQVEHHQTQRGHRYVEPAQSTGLSYGLVVVEVDVDLDRNLEQHHCYQHSSQSCHGQRSQHKASDTGDGRLEDDSVENGQQTDRNHQGSDGNQRDRESAITRPHIHQTGHRLHLSSPQNRDHALVG